jgi:hypothetical protein
VIGAAALNELKNIVGHEDLLVELLDWAYESGKTQ